MRRSVEDVYAVLSSPLLVATYVRAAGPCAIRDESVIVGRRGPRTKVARGRLTTIGLVVYSALSRAILANAIVVQQSHLSR